MKPMELMVQMTMKLHHLVTATAAIVAIAAIAIAAIATAAIASKKKRSLKNIGAIATQATVAVPDM